jgi:hypothetical protein
MPLEVILGGHIGPPNQHVRLLHFIASLVRTLLVEPIQEAILEDEDEVEILSDWPDAPVTSPPPPVKEMAEGFTTEHPKGVCIYFF